MIDFAEGTAARRRSPDTCALSVATRLAGDELGGDGLDALGLGAEGDARDVLDQRRVAGDALRQRREVAHPQRDALLGVRPQQLQSGHAAQMLSS